MLRGNAFATLLFSHAELEYDNFTIFPSDDITSLHHS